MNLQYSHKPNYYFFAHTLALMLESHVKQHPDHLQDSFSLDTINDWFHHDTASSSINLIGILDIVDDYNVATANGQVPLLSEYHLDYEKHELRVQFHPQAVQYLLAGQPLSYAKAA